MKFKVLFILTGVIILHAVILTGICLTGGCKSPAVLGPRAYIKAPPAEDEITDETPVPDIKVTAPKVTVRTTPVAMSSPPVFELGTPPQGIIYVVKRGDSFWKIAKKYGVSMRNLAAYNDMSLNKVLRIGEKLKIPPGGYVIKDTGTAAKTVKKSRPARIKPQPRPSDGVYVVKRGDSFWKIARRYNLRTKTLLDANNMTGRETLRIGQKLIIPDGKKSGSAAPSAAAVKTETAKASNDVKSILDAVDSPEETKSVAPAEKETAKKLVEDIDASSDASERAVQVIKDIKVADFAKQYKVTPELLKKLNDDYPADGVFKAGSVVIVRSVE